MDDIVKLRDALDVETWFANLTGVSLDTVLDILTIVAVIGVCFVACVFIWREVKTYQALKPHRRRRYVLRPTGDHQWDRDEVETWAAQLTTVQRRINWFMDRPAHALRIRLESTPRGPRYSLESSWRLDYSMGNPLLPGITITRLRPRSQSTRRPDGDEPARGRPSS